MHGSSKSYTRNDCTLPQDAKILVFNMVVVKQTLTITTPLEKVEIVGGWSLEFLTSWGGVQSYLE